MAILARGRSRFVKDYRLAGNLARQFMAIQTRHVLVGAIEGIFRPLIVVKLSWCPAHGVMTT